MPATPQIRFTKRQRNRIRYREARQTGQQQRQQCTYVRMLEPAFGRQGSRGYAGTETSASESADCELVEQHAFHPCKKPNGGSADDGGTAETHGYHTHLYNAWRGQPEITVNSIAVACGAMRIYNYRDSAHNARISGSSA